MFFTRSICSFSFLPQPGRKSYQSVEGNALLEAQLDKNLSNATLRQYYQHLQEEFEQKNTFPQNGLSLHPPHLALGRQFSAKSHSFGNIQS
jgi:hypothetical protein